MRKKSKDHGRDFRLKQIAHRYAQRRIGLIDQFADTPRDELGFGRVLQVAFDRVPGLRDLLAVSRVRLLALRDGVVELGADVAGLKIDNAHLVVGKFELDRHGEGGKRRFG